jgi:hypothetical protein
LLGPLDVAFDVIDVLDGLTVDYVLGGSLASSTFGEPRATNDVDIAIALTPSNLTPLVEEFQAREYYVPERSAAQAVSRRTSFNVVHPSGFKVDLFVLGDGVLDRLQLQRRVQIDLATEQPRTIWVTSPGDQILRKLDWYRLGQETSDRQWRDIIGLLHAQGPQLDTQMLRSDAERAELGPLLRRAFEVAGVEP